ncbi:hypothetical protein EKK58_00935 [Candidatus Dependentiae bacterium]|nr:MAG: hypothetical protein EKK58_00935 [Candidatus Dependentiae bacterium]
MDVLECSSWFVGLAFMNGVGAVSLVAHAERVVVSNPRPVLDHKILASIVHDGLTSLTLCFSMST